ncbi:hypothetical protein SVAN01_02150 [Stagonosporopsis vannaccii]|nr:hypothetical protein SVAN01_02150 [Stagonosporopsis vannaccii]
MSALAAVPNEAMLTPEYIAFTNAPVLLTQVGSLFAVTSIIVFSRIYVRTCMIKSFGKDDWLILLAYAFAAATFGVYVEQTKVGMGRHMAVITMDKWKYREFLRLRQVSSILASFGVALVKISIAYFLLRLVVHRGYVWFLHGLNIFMVLVTLACVGTLVSQTSPFIWQCIPVEATWNMKLRPPPYGSGTAKCFSPDTFTNIGLMNTIITIVTDFMIALLPIPLVWQLQLNLRSKISLMFVLSLGVFAAIAAIVKSEIQKTVFKDPDPFVHDRFTLWRFIELDIGIIAASLPALKPLFSWCLGAARNLTTRIQRPTDAPNSLGYQKHSERSDKDIVLGEIIGGPSNTVRIPSTRPLDGSIRVVGPGKESEESILPVHNIEEKAGTIFITRGVYVS